MKEVDRQGLKECGSLLDDALARVMDSKDEKLVAISDMLHGIGVLIEDMYKAADPAND